MAKYNFNNQFIIVKVGTTTMFKKTEYGEQLDARAFQYIGSQVIKIVNSGGLVAIVSSGAVTAGMQQINITKRPLGDTDPTKLQALATIGWPTVMANWGTALSPNYVGSFLLTKVSLDADNPERTEALQTMRSLIRMNGIPIINENDAITHSELSHNSYEQNDNLAANVAVCIAQSKIFGKLMVKLVMLSDVNGLYQDHNDHTTLIRQVDNVEEYMDYAKGSTSQHGKGGMKTKLEAAKIATASGVEVFITNGKNPKSITDALAKKSGPYFSAK
jgi:glutamate 5-kinase